MTSDESQAATERTARKAAGYKDLLVWRKGIELARKVYDLTQKFPTDERFGLVSQMRRAAVSIPSNIAEGQARNTTGEFVLFISHAEGSLAELDTQVVLCVELGRCAAEQVTDVVALMDELKRMLNSLRRKLSARAAAACRVPARHSSLVTRHC